VAATLHSSKAQSCLVSLRTPGGIWLSTSRGTVDSLVARVARGTYRLDVQCKLRLQRRASLAVRGARFARHERRSGNRRRTAPVPVEIGFKPV
jgi:hypothetical protein